MAAVPSIVDVARGPALPDTEARAPPALEVRGVAKSFGPVIALKDVSLELGRGEVRGLCGENGAGKSTLVKILTGVYRPDAGSISIAGVPHAIPNPRAAQACGLALVAQELSLCPDLSVEDNIWLGSVKVPFFHRQAGLRKKACEALDLLGAAEIPLSRPVRALSMGERQLVEIARMLTRDAQVLILDEPTATLTDAEIERIFGALLALKREGHSILYITHRLAEVFRVCDSVTVLRNGEVVGTRATRTIVRDELMEMMLGRPLDEMYPEPAPAPGGAPALLLENLSIPGAVDRFSMRVPRGTIVCVAGQIGSGAADVVNAIGGLVHRAEGRMVVNGRPLRFGSPAAALRRDVMFVSGDRAEEGVFRHLSVHDNLVATRLRRYSAFGVLNRRKLKAVASDLARRVGVDARRLRSRADELSGGNQQKLAFGRCVDRGPPGVLAMNEPTRGVDVGARAEIYRLMRAFSEAGHALIVASTDLEEVVGLGDVVITMYRGRQVGRYTREQATMSRIVADITHPLEAVT